MTSDTARPDRSPYGQAWQQFEAWCGRAGESALPCSDETLTGYVAHLIELGRMSPGTLRVHVCAIRARHSDSERPEAKAARGLIAAWKTESFSAGRLARPVSMLTEEQLTALLATCDSGSLRDRRDAAIITLAIGTAAQAQQLEGLRRCELSIEESGVTVRSETGLTGFAPRLANPRLDPVESMSMWLRTLEEIGAVSSFAFPLVDVQDRVHVESPSTRHTFRQIVQRRGLAAGLEEKRLTFQTLRASFIAGRGEAAFSESILAQQATWLPPLPSPRYGT